MSDILNQEELDALMSATIDENWLYTSYDNEIRFDKDSLVVLEGKVYAYDVMNQTIRNVALTVGSGNVPERAVKAVMMKRFNLVEAKNA